MPDARSDARERWGRLFPDEEKAAPAGYVGGVSGGPTYVDAFRTRRSPTPPEMVEAVKGIVYSCLHLNMNGVAKADLRLYAVTRRGEARPKCWTAPVTKARLKDLRSRPELKSTLMGAAEVEEVEDPEFPVLRALRNPCEGFDYHRFVSLLCWYLDTVGQAFVYPDPESGAVPDTLWPLLSQYVYPVFGGQTAAPSAYSYFGNVYEPADLMVFRHVSGKNPYAFGYGPTQAAFESVGLVDKFQSVQESFLGSGFRPSLLVSTKDATMPLGKPERARLEAELNAGWGGSNAGRVWVLDAGLEASPLNFPPKDLAELDISENAVRRVCNAFGVPLSLVQTEDVNRANAEAGHYQHATLAIEPRCRLIAAALTAWMHAQATRSERALAASGRAKKLDWTRLFFAFDSVVPADRKLQADIDKIYVDMGAVTRNEVREELGLDEQPWGEEPWQPNTLVTPTMAADAERRSADAAERMADMPPPQPGGGPPPPGAEDNGDEPEPDNSGDETDDEKGSAAPVVKAPSGIPDGGTLPTLGRQDAESILDAALTLTGTADAYHAGTLDAMGRVELLRAVRQVSRERLRAAAEAFVAESEPAAKAFGAGAVKRFFGGAGRFVRESILAGVLALGGPGPLSARDRQVIDEAVAVQRSYLDGFAEDVLDGTTPPAGIPARAELYGNATWAAAQGSAAGPPEAGEVWRRHHLGSDEPCAGCRAEMAKGWTTRADLAPIGSQECINACHCVVVQKVNGRALLWGKYEVDLD